MNSKICCFTGHRQIPEELVVRLPSRLDSLLERLIAEGYREFRCGGAQGFDTIAALKVLEKKKIYGESIRLCLYLPCKDQTRGWSESAKRAYSMVLERADEVHYTSEIYTRSCMHARNRALVDGSDLCVALCLSSHGGTAYTVSYAKSHSLPVIMLSESKNPDFS